MDLLFWADYKKFAKYVVVTILSVNIIVSKVISSFTCDFCQFGNTEDKSDSKISPIGFQESCVDVSSYPENSCLQSPPALVAAIAKFVNTSWNEDDDAQITNSTTTDWSEQKVTRDIEGAESNGVDLNSSDIIDSIDTLNSESSGTALFSDSCSSTAGWISQSSWSGDPLVSEIQTGINLIVSEDRFMSGDIPSSSASQHGPMWIKNLTSPASLGEGLNLEVNLQHIYNYGKMGVVGVAIFDWNGEVIFKVWIYDAWYETRTDACVGFYYLGSASSTQSVQKSGSWSGTLRVWYDKVDDAVKATCPGGLFTLVTDPSEAELCRYARTVAIYFAGLQIRNYQLKYIDSIYLSVDTDPDTSFEACPLTPAMDGHWFPQTAYSRLYFRVNQPYFDTYFYLRIRIEADQDTYDRTLTVRVDGIIYYSNRILDESGFDGLIAILGWGTRNVEIEIKWGANVAKGWKLLHFFPERVNGQPLEVIGEFFPQTNIAHLTYQVQLGSDTRINLKLEENLDTIPRTIRVYIDGQFKHSGTGDNAWEWSLGDYPDGSIHELVVELQWGGFAEWGKILTINRIHHFKGGIEIDYMSGHAPSQEDLDVLEAYYILSGYDRAEFYIDDLIPFVNEFDLANGGYLSQQYWDYSNAYRNHAGDWRWEWMLCLHYLLVDGERSDSLGYHISPHYGIIIHDQKLLDNAAPWWTPPISAYRRSVIFHEYGHHINIIDRLVTGSERYCINWLCAMSTADFNIVNYPWYCEHHWSLRRWPGW